jgi:hypothetical protein
LFTTTKILDFPSTAKTGLLRIYQKMQLIARISHAQLQRLPHILLHSATHRGQFPELLKDFVFGVAKQTTERGITLAFWCGEAQTCSRCECGVTPAAVVTQLQQFKQRCMVQQLM